MSAAKTYDFEDRLVQFAAGVARFSNELFGSAVGNYYANQIIRSAGSAALNYGEAQGTTTVKDFIHKASVTLKELKETRVALKILIELKLGKASSSPGLLKECEELIAITATMIKNKK